ncbi:MAG: response regulator transcription factor [Bacteroidota bacterium]
MEQSIRIIIIDDHEMVLQGLGTLVNNYPGIEILGLFLDGNAAIAAVDELNPDIVLTDINMPIINGFDTAEQILKKNPDIKVAMLSMENKEGYITKAQEAGASAYVLKDAPVEHLISVIKKVYQGETHFEV